MANALTKYDQKVINRAIELYNTEVNGKRIYRVDSIPDIIRSEFPGRADKLTRATIYFWLKRYDLINYRIRKGEIK